MAVIVTGTISIDKTGARVMNIRNLCVLVSLFCIISVNAFAQPVSSEDMAQVSRSAGKKVDDTSINLQSALKTQAPVTGLPRSEQNPVAGRLANRYDQYFSIYSAGVELLADIDGDGFHHRLNVIFDVDVDYDAATVYAKLYLSREGGPWIQYADTDLFDIYSDDVADTYEVTTELIEGYPPGYYSVLIEVYSLNDSYMVASEIIDNQYLGRSVMLEDLQRDEIIAYEEYGYYEEVEFVETHGAGSFSLFYWLLIAQVVIAARVILTLNPRVTSIKRKRISLGCGPFGQDKHR